VEISELPHLILKANNAETFLKISLIKCSPIIHFQAFFLFEKDMRQTAKIIISCR